MSKKLFVCGSLCAGKVHHKIIQDAVISEVPAVVKGSVYRLESGYHVFLEEGVAHVKGYIYELQESSVLDAILDEFHGVNHKQPNRSLYQRLNCSALAGSEMLDVDVFALRKKKLPKEAIQIVHGDWEEDFRAQTPLNERFNEDQILYIEKIGKTTGREVIPYTPMTRDLEKMGIVIDKGRRPALTNLGKEYFKYLDL
ncbi:MAG: gamma-glutamylcyclotransferase family protein [Bdellovibrionales bacterium]